MSNLEWFFIIYDSFFILEFSTSCHALPILFHGLLYLSQARQPLDSLVNTQASQWSTTTRTQETTYRDSRPRVGTGTRGRSKVESGQGHRAPRGRPRLSVRPLHMDWNVGRTTQWPLCSSFIASSVHLYHTRAYIYHTCVFTWTYLWDDWFLRMLKIFILVQLYMYWDVRVYMTVHTSACIVHFKAFMWILCDLSSYFKKSFPVQMFIFFQTVTYRQGSYIYWYMFRLKRYICVLYYAKMYEEQILKY